MTISGHGVQATQEHAYTPGAVLSWWGVRNRIHTPLERTSASATRFKICSAPSMMIGRGICAGRERQHGLAVNDHCWTKKQLQEGRENRRKHYFHSLPSALGACDAVQQVAPVGPPPTGRPWPEGSTQSSR